MPLSDSQCRAAKPQNKLYRMFDGGGLYLQVMPNGAKYWRVKYRLFGKERRSALGVYPAITLSDARSRRDELKKKVQAGTDPLLAKREQLQTAAYQHSQTFDMIAIEWQAKNTQYWSARYAQTIKHRFQKYIFPEIGTFPISQLTPVIVLACLEKVDKNAPEMARRVKQYISQVFKYGMATGRAEKDCTFGLEKALRRYKKGHFASVGVDGLPMLLDAIHNHKTRLTRQTYLAIQLMLLTFVRTKELIEAEWTEIDFERKLWTIPGERMKMKLPHLVPLADQSIKILMELKGMNGKRVHVFPSIPRPQKPMSNGTILVALKRMGLEGQMTGHGFRSLALGVLKEKLGYSHEVADRQLAHVKKSSTDKAYDRAEFLEQRTEMMQRYSDYLKVACSEALKKGIFDNSALVDTLK